MSQVEMRTARTSLSDPEQAAEDLCTQLGGMRPKLVTVFAARAYDHPALNRALRERLGYGTRLLGASTQGEIDNTGIHSGGAVLGALAGDFDVGIGLGRGLTAGAVAAGQQAVQAAARELGFRPQDLESRRCVGLVIDDAFRYKKEELLLGMLDRNQGLVLVGGGAADAEMDPARQSAVVHADGEVATDAVVLAVFRTDAPWAALRSHWYLPTGRTLTITKVDETAKRALEIDGQPAARRYAELLGVTVDDLEFGKPRGFATRPTALRVGREHFIRAPWKPLDDGSILFANLLEEGTELELMEIGDVVGSTRAFLEQELPARCRNPTALLAFQCSGRKWFSDSLGKTAELGAAFAAAPPTAGMNVYFEIYCGFHINTTLTALVFGRDG